MKATPKGAANAFRGLTDSLGVSKERLMQVLYCIDPGVHFWTYTLLNNLRNILACAPMIGGR